MKDYLVVNPETNEAKYIDSDGVVQSEGRFVPKEVDEKAQRQLEGYRQAKQKEDAINRGKGLEWIGCFRDSIKEVASELKPIPCGVLITILVKMQLGKDGLLINGGRPMNVGDIGKHIKKSRTQTSEYLSKFVKLGILEELPDNEDTREKNYRVNPNYHLMGKFPKSTEENRFVKLFKNTLKEMIENLKLSELGFIYKALSICHHNTFKLVHNPTARYNPTAKEGSVEASSNTDLELFNRKELASYMKVNTKTIDNIVSSLSKKGFIMSNTTSGVTSYRLHPHIIYLSGPLGDEYIQSVCNEFDIHKKEALRRSKKA